MGRMGCHLVVFWDFGKFGNPGRLVILFLIFGIPGEMLGWIPEIVLELLMFVCGMPVQIFVGFPGVRRHVCMWFVMYLVLFYQTRHVPTH